MRFIDRNAGGTLSKPCGDRFKPTAAVFFQQGIRLFEMCRKRREPHVLLQQHHNFTGQEPADGLHDKG
jgi:hypothetical protein